MSRVNCQEKKSRRGKDVVLSKENRFFSTSLQGGAHGDGKGQLRMFLQLQGQMRSEEVKFGCPTSSLHNHTILRLLQRHVFVGKIVLIGEPCVVKLRACVCLEELPLSSTQPCTTPQGHRKKHQTQQIPLNQTWKWLSSV